MLPRPGFQNTYSTILDAWRVLPCKAPPFLCSSQDASVLLSLSLSLSLSLPLPPSLLARALACSLSLSQPSPRRPRRAAGAWQPDLKRPLDRTESSRVTAGHESSRVTARVQRRSTPSPERLACEAGGGTLSPLPLSVPGRQAGGRRRRERRARWLRGGRPEAVSPRRAAAAASCSQGTQSCRAPSSPAGARAARSVVRARARAGAGRARPLFGRPLAARRLDSESCRCPSRHDGGRGGKGR
jgi:hypothetical protein